MDSNDVFTNIHLLKEIRQLSLLSLNFLRANRYIFSLVYSLSSPLFFYRISSHPYFAGAGWLSPSQSTVDFSSSPFRRGSKYSFIVLLLLFGSFKLHCEGVFASSCMCVIFFVFGFRCHLSHFSLFWHLAGWRLCCMVIFRLDDRVPSSLIGSIFYGGCSLRA